MYANTNAKMYLYTCTRVHDMYYEASMSQDEQRTKGVTSHTLRAS